MHFVFLLINFLSLTMSKHEFSISTSHNTGVAPAHIIGVTDAINVKLGTITSSPFSKTLIYIYALKINLNASKPLETPIACLTPKYNLKSFSICFTFSPNKYQPESMTLKSAFLSSLLYFLFIFFKSKNLIIF